MPVKCAGGMQIGVSTHKEFADRFGGADSQEERTRGNGRVTMEYTYKFDGGMVIISTDKTTDIIIEIEICDNN